jgi:hypothetical protein
VPQLRRMATELSLVSLKSSPGDGAMTPTVSSTSRLSVTTDPWSPELVVRYIFFASQNPPIGPITS